MPVFHIGEETELLHMTFNDSKHDLQDLARGRERHIRLNKVLEQSDVIKRRVKELKQAVPPEYSSALILLALFWLSA